MIKIPKKIQLAVFFLVGLALLLLWMQGVFRARVGPGEAEVPGAAGPGETYEAGWRTVRDWQEAPGLVVSREQPQAAAQIMGRILEVRVAPGDRVRRGQVLAVIDEAEVRSRLGQAQDQLAAVQAQYRQAETDYRRFQNLVGRKVVAVREFDQVKARYQTLEAQVQQARQGVNEAQAAFRYRHVVSPVDGLVAEKLVNVGDLATPGRPLLTLYDPEQMRLEAQVGEQFGPALQRGAAARVAIPSLNLEVETAIVEVEAQAASASRTFEVKAPLPAHPDLRPGMFGRLFFDGRERRVLLIPAAAVKSIGQLETVQVAGPQGVRLRQIRTGRTYGTEVEVLAGLQAGERVAVGGKE
jgi:RND family efflux transporter MFP subunit